MTRYLLDTNVVSEVARQTPDVALADLFAQREPSELFISTMTLAEVWRGILLKPEGHKRRQLET